jgi:hypothetical protein
MTNLDIWLLSTPDFDVNLRLKPALAVIEYEFRVQGPGPVIKINSGDISGYENNRSFSIAFIDFAGHGWLRGWRRGWQRHQR